LAVGLVRKIMNLCRAWAEAAKRRFRLCGTKGREASVPETMTEEEKLAQAWLQSRGYAAEFEPEIVKEGRSPDFRARGSAEPNSLWAEVKTLDPEDVSVVMGRAANIIHATSLPGNLRGFATVFVNGVTRDQSVRYVLKLFAEHAPKYKNETVRLIFTQQAPDAKGLRRVDAGSLTPPELFWIRGAGDQKFAVPPGVLEDGLSMVTVHEGGVDRTVAAFHLFEWTAPLDCALVAKLDPTEHPLSVHPMGGGFVSVGSRVLKAIESANGQIKNGCRYHKAPGMGGYR